MPGFSPVPLPSLSTLFDQSVNNFAGAPSPLPSIGLVMNPVPAKVIAATVGAFSLTGKAATLKAGRKVSASAGAFSVTGSDAALTANTPGGGVDAPAPLPSLGLVLALRAGVHFVIAQSGAFSLTGRSATMFRGAVMAAQNGVFALSGATSQSDYQMTASPGSFAVTGTAATLTKASPGTNAGAGAFVLTGYPANLVYQTAGAKVLPTFPGQFVITGNPATLTRSGYILQAATGQFALAGSNASLGFVGWVRVDQASGAWTSVSPSTTTWTNA